MKKNLKTLATSLTTLVFLVVGISGVFLYFHIFERSVKELHEILGLLFVAAALFHLFFNFNSMKNYFKNKIFVFSSVVIVLVSLAFIIPNSQNTAPSPKGIIIKSVLNGTIEDSVAILGSDMDQLELKLKNVGITLKDEATINQLAKSNNISAYKIVDMITQKND